MALCANRTVFELIHRLYLCYYQYVVAYYQLKKHKCLAQLLLYVRIGLVDTRIARISKLMNSTQNSLSNDSV